MKVEEVVMEMNEFDFFMCDFSQFVNLEMVKRRKDLTNFVWKNLQKNKSLLRQKSRQKWVIKGDFNTRYFHNVMKSRRRRNEIVFIETTRGGVEEVKEFKDEVKRVF